MIDFNFLYDYSLKWVFTLVTIPIHLHTLLERVLKVLVDSSITQCVSYLLVNNMLV